MLDLTKLKALELPTAEVEVEILGETQTVKVHAPNDEIAAKLYGIGTDKKRSDTQVTIDIARLILGSCVPDLTAEDAELLLTRALTTAVFPIVAKVRDLRLEFDEAKMEAAVKAKKKSEPATSPTEKSCSSAAGNATI
jgi:hypothetical protein